ncbi:MAG: formylglycine-generating enzyme family protein [Phycisphaerae bacterium]|jgi:formylglycine-generating enzyme required for sulfatase activity|nr:formylglycine-generating enzyme family protein [Phycisphaerae bacterium]
MCFRSAAAFFLAATVSLTFHVATPTCRGADTPPAAEAKPKVDPSTWAKVSPAQTAAARKLGVPVAFENSVGMRFVLIPPGEFMMGSKDSSAQVASNCAMPNAAPGWFVDEHPRHKVTLTKAFYMSIHEVTNASYEALFAKPKPKKPKKPRKPSKAPEAPPEVKVPNEPIVKISFSVAEKFCKTLSGKEKRTYAMPTEAQWEYAYRAGTETAFSFGQAASTDKANYHGNYIYGPGKKGKNRAKPVVVGSLPPNAWGLYEMHGNLSEWCSDSYQRYTAEPQTDPTGPEKKERQRVLRGGSWRSYPGACRSAFRHGMDSNTSSETIGFRVVCSLTTDPPEEPKKKK